MTFDDKIRDEKFQYDINREAAKISVLSSGKIDKYEYLAGEEILSSDQTKFTYSPLGKEFKKQRKTIEDQDKKQINAIEDHRKQFLESNELTKKDDFNISRDDLVKERYFEFQNFLKNLILII